MEGTTIVCWPEIQYLYGQRGFEQHATLITSGPDYEEYGDCAYYVEEDWLDSLSEPIKQMIGL